MFGYCGCGGVWRGACAVCVYVLAVNVGSAGGEGIAVLAACVTLLKAIELEFCEVVRVLVRLESREEEWM